MGFCLCNQTQKGVSLFELYLYHLIQIFIKSNSDVNLPIIVNTIYSNQNSTPREIDSNEESVNNFINNKRENSLKKKKAESESKIIFGKSGTYDFGGGNYYNNINHLNDMHNNNKVKKSKSFQENEINVFNINDHFHMYNYYGKYHLDTVLETINEASFSKMGSSKISNNNPNGNNNILINTNNKSSSKKIDIKINNENKIQDSDNKIFCSEDNTASISGTVGVNTKKSLYIMKSEKTD